MTGLHKSVGEEEGVREGGREGGEGVKDVGLGWLRYDRGRVRIWGGGVGAFVCVKSTVKRDDKEGGEGEGEEKEENKDRGQEGKARQEAGGKE